MSKPDIDHTVVRLVLFLNFDVDGTLKKNREHKSTGRPYYVSKEFWKENIARLINKYEKFLNIHARLLTSRLQHSKELSAIADDLGFYSIKSNGEKIPNSNDYYTLYHLSEESFSKEFRTKKFQRT